MQNVKKTRWLRMLTCLLLITVIVSGCTSGNGEQAGGSTAGNDGDTSSHVKLVGYLLGDAPPGMNAVVEELNKKLTEDINAEIEFRYIGWGDLASKYPLVLAAGDDVDFIFTANWAYYNQEAAKGAFREITMEEIEKFMPKHYEATNPVAWDEAKIGDKVYMIPTSSPDQKVPVTIIRGDLRKKYGIPEIKRFQDLEPYLAAIKANEPAIIPINADSQYDFAKTFYNLQWEMGPATVDTMLITNGWSGTHTEWDDPDGKVYSQFDPHIKDQQIQIAKIVKDWYDKGYINKNAMSNKVRSKDAFEQGTSAVAYGNTTDIQTTLAKAQGQGWEVEIIPNLSPTGTYLQDPYINNGIAIAAGTKNPDRAMMALDLIMEEPSYNKLVYFGIEGVNYVEKDGKIDLPDGVTADNNTYAPDAAGFWFTNKSQFPPMANWTEQYTTLKDSLDDMLVPYIYNAFSADTSTIKTELANLNTVATQYQLPIQGGVVKDVEQAYAELEAKAKAAGFDRVLAEAEQQTQQFHEKKK